MISAALAEHGRVTKTGKTLLFICWDLCSIIIFNVGGRKIVRKQIRKENLSGKGS